MAFNLKRYKQAQYYFEDPPKAAPPAVPPSPPPPSPPRSKPKLEPEFQKVQPTPPPSPPKAKARPVVQSPPVQAPIVGPQQPVSQKFRPSPGQIKDIQQFIRGALHNFLMQEMVGDMLAERPDINTPEAKVYIANETWRMVSDKAGATAWTEPKLIEDFLAELLGDLNLAVMPEQYAGAFEKAIPEAEETEDLPSPDFPEEAAEAAGAGEGGMHAQLMEQMVKEHQNDPNTPLWQAVANFEDVRDGLFLSISNNLSDSMKYAFFKQFPQYLDQIPGSVEQMATEGIDLQGGERAFSTAINRLSQEHPVRESLDGILTDLIMSNFEEGRQVDFSGKSWNDVQDELSDIEKFIVRKAKGAGRWNPAGVKKERAGQFATDTETGGTLEPIGIKGRNVKEELTDVEKQDVVSTLVDLTGPTIAATQELVTDFADLWRTKILEKGGSKRDAHLSYADTLELVSELAANAMNPQNLLNPEFLKTREGKGFKGLIFQRPGQNNYALKFRPKVDAKTRQVISYDPPPLFEASSDADFEKALGNLIAKKQTILNTYAKTYETADTGSARVHLIDSASTALQQSYPDQDYSPAFILATLEQGKSGLQYLQSQTRKAFKEKEEKGLPGHVPGKHGPRAQLRHNIQPALKYLDDLVEENPQYDQDVISSFFGLIGTIGGVQQPFHLDENNELKWAPRMATVKGKKTPAIDAETGLPIYVPSMKNPTYVNNFARYYKLTGSQMSEILQTALVESGIIPSERPTKEISEDGKFVKQRLDPSRYSLAQRTMFASLTKHASHLRQKLISLKYAMFKQSSVNRTTEGCERLKQIALNIAREFNKQARLILF